MEKILVDVPGYGQSKNGKELLKFNLQPGDSAYLYDSSNYGFEDTNEWRKIKITYRRLDMIFFIFEDNNKEHCFNRHCVFVNMGKVKPVEWIVDTKTFPTEYYKFVCDCPYTKIIE